jgi:hypothetical protein
MKKLVLALLVGLFALTGCARHYVMKLSNGTRITAASKPKYKEGAYYFKNAYGQEQSIPSGRVTEIEPASMAEKEKSPFIPRTAH